LLTRIAATESVTLWRADKMLTAFVELESAVHTCGHLAEGQSSLASPAIFETGQNEAQLV
jgi:hypothetical protein